MDVWSYKNGTFSFNGTSEVLTESGVATMAARQSSANAGPNQKRENEFGSQSDLIATRYAEWDKRSYCRSAMKKALVEAYLMGRRDADTLTPRK